MSKCLFITLLILIFLILCLALISSCSMADILSRNNKYSVDNKISMQKIVGYHSNIIINEEGLSYGIVPDTGSMLPAIPHNSTILFKKDFDEIKVGDIVQANNGDDNCKVLHRVIKITEKDNKIIYTTQGDNNRVADSCIFEEKDIKSVIVGVIY